MSFSKVYVDQFNCLKIKQLGDLVKQPTVSPGFFSSRLEF